MHDAVSYIIIVNVCNLDDSGFWCQGMWRVSEEYGMKEKGSMRVSMMGRGVKGKGLRKDGLASISVSIEHYWAVDGTGFDTGMCMKVMKAVIGLVLMMNFVGLIVFHIQLAIFVHLYF